MTTATDSPVKNQQKDPGFVEFIALIAVITSLAALSIDAMLPALPMMATDLAVADFRQTQWVITSVILGMSVGQMFFGPFSDAYGRKFSILSGIGLFCLGSLVSMFATSMTMMLVGRVIQGIGVAGPRIASMALVRDKFVGDHMARVMSFVMMVFILVPMLAPMVGLAILHAMGWRAIFGLFILLSIMTGIWLFVRQPETLSVIGRRPFRLGKIVDTTKAVVKHPRVLGFSAAAGLIFGGMLAYVASAQSIFQDIYGLGDKFPFFFAALALGFGIASLVNGKLVVRLGAEPIATFMLYCLIGISAVASLAALLSGGSPPLWLFMILAFGMFFCIGILFGNLNALAMVPLGKMAGIGAAIIGSISNVIAVFMSAVIGWFYIDSLAPILVGILLSSILALVIVKGIKHKLNTDVD